MNLYEGLQFLLQLRLSLNGLLGFRNAKGLVTTGDLGRLQKCSKCCVSVLVYLHFISIQLTHVQKLEMANSVSEASARREVFLEYLTVFYYFCFFLSQI